MGWAGLISREAMMDVVCPIDLEFGLPVQVRDQAIGMKDDLPKNDINREYFMQSVDKQVGGLGRSVRVKGLGRRNM